MDRRAPRITVIIPTHQRRDLVVTNVRALARQDFAGGFEVIVVIDGSTDRTAEALRALQLPFPLQVVEQSRRGAAVARNRGAALARGAILLFLDDDMEAHHGMLSAHESAHSAGADVVLGNIPLHPRAPSNLLSDGVRAWADERAYRLSLQGAPLEVGDLLTGQLSVAASVFRRANGFDPSFTAGGSFGNEDLDLGQRLLNNGHRIVYNHHAVSWQNYVVAPRQYLRQYRQAGRADVAFVRKHPDQRSVIFPREKLEARLTRWVWRPIAHRPWLAAVLAVPLHWLAVRLVNGGRRDAWAGRWFHNIKDFEYWRGVIEAGDIEGRDPAGLPHRAARHVAV
jgi:glycosyltransferase involved in cell wall biosynthesis